MNVSNAAKDIVTDKTKVDAILDVLQRSNGDITKYLNENNAEYVSKMYWIMNIASILMLIIFIIAIIFLTLFIMKTARKFNKTLIGSFLSHALPSFFISISIVYIVTLLILTFIPSVFSANLKANLNSTLKGTNEVHTEKVITVKNIYTENPIDNDAKDNKNEKYNYITYELDGKTGLVKVKRTEFKQHMPKNEEQIKIYTKPAFVDKNKVGKYNKDVDQKLKSTKSATLVHLSKDANDTNGKNAYWLSGLPDPNPK